jgi:hypothetical protein
VTHEDHCLCFLKYCAVEPITARAVDATRTKIVARARPPPASPDAAVGDELSCRASSRSPRWPPTGLGPPTPVGVGVPGPGEVEGLGLGDGVGDGDGLGLGDGDGLGEGEGVGVPAAVAVMHIENSDVDEPLFVAVAVTGSPGGAAVPTVMLNKALPEPSVVVVPEPR